jgi:predicted outer membrane repeat protein
VPATLTVNTTLDVLGHANGMLSLRQAVLDANARTTADTIVVPAGTYNLTGSGGEPFIGDLDISASPAWPLTISGAGADTTIIDGGGHDRIFDINFAGPVSISGLTMQHGNPGLANGGAIFTQYATLSVSNCTLSDNTAYSGGAIESLGMNSGSLTVTNCSFSGNTTDNPHGGNGGAIYAGGTLTVSNCIFSDNFSNLAGGAIYSSAAATVSSSSFSDNSAVRGGAIFNNGTMTVSNCTLSGNSASQYGGGISNNGKLVIRGSTVSDNTALVGPDLFGSASISDSTIGDTYYP